MITFGLFQKFFFFWPFGRLLVSLFFCYGIDRGMVLKDAHFQTSSSPVRWVLDDGSLKYFDVDSTHFFVSTLKTPIDAISFKH